MSEIANFLNLVKAVYGAFGYDQFSVQISLRPEQRLGEDDLWDRAEAVLMAACESLGQAYELQPGEGAFYGPKIEVSLQDHRGRSWQCGTIQIDFNLPQVFDLSFINPQGKAEMPVMLHQAVLGSLERWIGILLENQGGALPLWLAPVQVAMINLSESSAEWAAALHARLQHHKIRVELHANDRHLSKQIRDLSDRKIPLIAVVGEREANSEMIQLRRLGDARSVQVSLAQLEAELAEAAFLP